MNRAALALATLAACAPATPPPARSEPQARIFRHLLVGALVRVPVRLTWTEWMHDGHTRLRVACQAGGHAKIAGLGRPGLVGAALTGQENDDRYWSPPVVVEFRDTDATGELVAISPPPTQRGCSGLPARLRLTCKPDRVAVLPVGAALLPGGTWRPSTRTTIDAERCAVALPDATPGASWLADTIAAQPLV